MAQKPGIPKGTRDFGPVEMARRNYIFSTIREVFKLFGYRQIETPAMENLSTLMGKYGDEGDKLLFKILNSGDFMKGVDPKDLADNNLPRLTRELCEKGLRYDLTVPFARYVVQHRNEIQTPFKRFQIQPVWRADRPQKGRYREFYQCDADVVGSDSLFNEIELLKMLDEVFSRFGINVVIKLNNRKVLFGIAQIIGREDQIIDLTVAIDKIDKIGEENVIAELRDKGFDDTALEKIRPLLSLSGSNEDKLGVLTSLLSQSEVGLKGIEELREVISGIDAIGHKAVVELDVSLARGLNYYTGTIIEVKAADVAIGSISGGGRYDNLTGVFGLDGLSGVGVSFGADRIYDVLNQLDLYPSEVESTVSVMFVNFGRNESLQALKYINLLHNAGVSAILYPDAAKMKKQMGYADNLNVPYVAIIGESELENNTVTVKNMTSGEQTSVAASDLCKFFR